MISYGKFVPFLGLKKKKTYLVTLLLAEKEEWIYQFILLLL